MLLEIATVDDKRVEIVVLVVVDAGDAQHFAAISHVALYAAVGQQRHVAVELEEVLVTRVRIGDQLAVAAERVFDV